MQRHAIDEKKHMKPKQASHKIQTRFESLSNSPEPRKNKVSHCIWSQSRKNKVNTTHCIWSQSRKNKVNTTHCIWSESRGDKGSHCIWSHSKKIKVKKQLQLVPLREEHSQRHTLHLQTHSDHSYQSCKGNALDEQKKMKPSHCSKTKHD